jgi:hypothetical protein
MANATLTRPVVTMNLANRSIGRFGLAANRALHPLAAGHFGRQVAPLAVISDLKIVPSEKGIVAETSFASIDINQPVYSRLLGKAGVSEIDVPKGTDEDRIGDIFRAVTTRTPAKADRMLGDGISFTKNKESETITWKEIYESKKPYHYRDDIGLGCFSSILGAFGGAILGGYLGVHIDYATGLSDNLSEGSIFTFSGIVAGIPTGFISGLIISTMLLPRSLYILRRALSHKEEYYMATVSNLTTKGVKAPEEMFEYLADAYFESSKALNARFDKDRKALAINPFTPDNILINIALAYRGITDLCISAFDNLNERGLSADQLVSLAESESVVVREKVAQHPNTPVDALMKLAKSNGYPDLIAFGILDKRGLTPEQLSSLAKSYSDDVREKVAQHPNTPVDALMKLASHGGYNYPSIAFDNLDKRGLTPEQLASLAESNNIDVRTWVAKHPATPSVNIAYIIGNMDINKLRDVGGKWEPEYEKVIDGYRHVGGESGASVFVGEIIEDYHYEKRGQTWHSNYELYEDFSCLATVINNHSLGKKIQILAELEKLDHERYASVRPLVNLED